MTETTPTPAPAPAANPDGDRTMAAVAYILTWITGLIIFFVAKKEDKYARWHAIQAIGYGIGVWVIAIILGILPLPGFILQLWWVLVIVGVIILAIKAYQGEKMRLPIVADMADKNA